jgi:hypothetical protein
MTDKIKPEGDENAFIRDLALAQAEMENAAYNRVNPHFKSQYADFAAVRAATLPALNKYGFAITQSIVEVPDQNGAVTKYLKTYLWHKSLPNPVTSCDFLIPPGTVQQIGSAITYARRYSWSAICGIASEEDDDANEAMSAGRGTSQETLGRVQLNKEKSRSIYDALVKEMRSLTNQSDLTAWGLESTDRIYSMHDDFQRWFRDEYANHLTAIKEGVTEDGAELGEPE